MRITRHGLRWEIAARPKRIKLLPEGRMKRALQAAERAKVEHPFRVIKRQFGLVKVRFKGLAKNTDHRGWPGDHEPALSMRR